MLLDFLGALSSLLSTYYFIRLDSKAWSISLIAICLNGYLYWQKGIYADMVLEGFYFLSTCYGWYLWRQPSKQAVLFEVTKLSWKQGLFLFISISLIYSLITQLLSNFTTSNVPNLDALTTALSLAAQWLMCHKIIATWILWFFIDALYAYLYFFKQLPFHGLLMLLYTSMAVIGYLRWAEKLEKKAPLLAQ